MTRLALALLLSLSLSLSRPAMAAALPEAQVKAAFIVNFLLFTHWPGRAEPPSPLRLCLLGEDGVAKALRHLDGRKLGKGVVNITGEQGAGKLAGCHALYVAPQSHSRWQEWMASPRGRGILSITDAGERLSGGRPAVLAVAVQNDRVVFDLDLALARRQQIGFDARVLRLAQRESMR